MTITLESPSGMLAAEVRAEIARQGLTAKDLAGRIGENAAWVSRRLGRNAEVALTLDEVVKIADALDVSAQGILLAVLPRLDSNQQPSGYLFPLVSGPQCVYCGTPGMPICSDCSQRYGLDEDEACWCPEETPVHHPACPDRLTRADLMAVA